MASELVEYIIDALKKGYSENSLRQTLLGQGWNMNEVNQAFAVALSYQSPQPTMQPSAPQTMQPQAGAVQSPAFSKKMKLRRVGIFSTAKVSAIIAGVMGLLIGIMFAIPSLILGAAVPDIISAGNVTGIDVFNFSGMLAGLGILMAVVLPVILAIVGFIMGALSALVYNIVARLVGGYEVEFE